MLIIICSFFRSKVKVKYKYYTVYSYTVNKELCSLWVCDIVQYFYYYLCIKKQFSLELIAWGPGCSWSQGGGRRPLSCLRSSTIPQRHSSNHQRHYSNNQRPIILLQLKKLRPTILRTTRVRNRRTTRRKKSALGLNPRRTQWVGRPVDSSRNQASAGQPKKQIME